MACDLLHFVQDWYSQHCDGDWEHQHGVEIGTLDNPGWRLFVDLTDTALEGRRLERQYVERSPEDWLRFWSDGEQFQAAAGPKNLIEALEAFKAFAEAGAPATRSRKLSRHEWKRYPRRRR